MTTCKCETYLGSQKGICSTCNLPLHSSKGRTKRFGDNVTNQPSSNTFEYENMECDQCGAGLLQDQKFCGSCGVEIVWPETTGRPVRREANSENHTKNIWIIVAAVIGAFVLFGLFSSGGTNQQEECYKYEMTKAGAYFDPKAWSIKSRIYCQSMYP